MVNGNKVQPDQFWAANYGELVAIGYYVVYHILCSSQIYWLVNERRLAISKVDCSNSGS